MTSMVLHKISDSTGETLDVVARACLVQFPDVKVVEQRWSMVRDRKQVAKILQEIEANPGFVIFTLVDDGLSEQLSYGCKRLKVPCIDLINPVLGQLGNYLGVQGEHRPGSQHVMDADYFSKIAALHFVLSHDDGQSLHDINEADVVLMGVSRTTKTPTSIFLANKGIKAANFPIMLGSPIPDEIKSASRPLIVGITKDPRRLVQVRRQRLKMQGHAEDTDYVDLDAVKQEISEARKLYNDNNWPIIDVTRKSVEESAATIMQLYHERIETEA